MQAMRRIHSFKAGRQTASNGATIDFTEGDLAATAAAYDPALSEAPIVVGHPSTDGPAYGWVKSFTAQGADLFADPDNGTLGAEDEQAITDLLQDWLAGVFD